MEGELTNIALGGFAGALVALGIFFVILFSLAVYVYFSWAWMTLAKKKGYKRAWLAWIPIANLAMILQLGGFSWVWIFLILIPVLGWLALFVMFIIASWRIFESRDYPGWFSLSIIVPEVGWILYAVALGFVAWKDKNIVQKAKTKVRQAKRKVSKKRRR